MQTHTHRSQTRLTDRAFTGCVADSGSRCNPDAHGGVAHVDRCGCGATRRVNVNLGESEYGPWTTS